MCETAFWYDVVTMYTIRLCLDHLTGLVTVS